MVTVALRQILAEPRVPNRPGSDGRDRMFVVVVLAVALVEIALRTDLAPLPLTIGLGFLPLTSFFWRRSHPIAVVAVTFLGHFLSEAVTTSSLSNGYSAMLYTTVVVATLPYTLFRWASGRECVIGTIIMLVVHFPSRSTGVDTVIEFAAAVLFILFPSALGAAMRYRTSSKAHETGQVKLREREQLARELHDSVAHHVSAIIIQAQAGRAVADTNPAAAQQTLETIEQEAKRTLSEMRSMVAALRTSDRPDLAPQQGIADIQHLARASGDKPYVNVQLAQGLDNLRPLVSAALYRLAQESVTNAFKHSRHATSVNVSLEAEGDFVRLTVQDDGDPVSLGQSGTWGYGLIGMTERAKLLGGTLRAGPKTGRGWLVEATLPRNA